MNSQNINTSTITLLILCLIMNKAVNAQRPSYAGSRPQSGYKDRFRPTTDTPPQEDVVSRFGENLNRPQQPPIPGSNVVQPVQGFIPINQQFSGTGSNTDIGNRNSFDSSRLPYDALGDRELVERLSRLPVDQQPFWFVNAQLIETHRNQSATQFNSFNPIAQRGSFAGAGDLSNRFSSSGIQQQQQQQQQPQRLPIQRQQPQPQRQQLPSIQVQQPQLQLQQPQSQLQQQQPIAIANRGDFGGSTFGNNLIDDNRRLPTRVNPVVQISNPSDSQGGRFVYVGPQLYNELKQANLVA